MPSLIGSLLRQASRKPDEKLNILTFPTHERYETGLAKTGHNFFAYRGKDIKDWNTTFAPLPANYHLLNYEEEMSLDIDVDLVLSQNKFGQFNYAKQFSQKYNCPLISLEHTLPPTGMSDLKEKFNKMKGHANVFISEYSVAQWGYALSQSVVIHHGIDTKLFHPTNTNKEIRKPYLLSVVNDWINRDWCCGFKLWQEVSRGKQVCVVGDSPGLSKPANGVNELVRFYQDAPIFLNTSLISPVPTALLEAMSCGCAVVSTATCMIPEIINHGVNGFISNNPEELKEYCQILLDNPVLAARLGKMARMTIEQNFSMDKFVKSWNGLFNYLSSGTFIKE